MVRPDAGQAVGLQFQANRQRIGLALADALLHRMHFARNSQQVLDVMTDFVGDDVRLREIAGRPETRPHLVVEAQVDVGLLVGGTVERTHRRLSQAAGRASRAAEQHQHGLFVTSAHLPELRGPDVFGVGDHDRDHVRQRGRS